MVQLDMNGSIDSHRIMSEVSFDASPAPIKSASQTDFEAFPQIGNFSNPRLKYYTPAPTAH